MKKIKILIVLNFFLLLSCSEESNHEESNHVSALCDSSNTLFNQLYNSVVAIPYNADGISFPQEVHSYNFEVLAPKTLCKIGYQSISSMTSIPYLIEIIDNTSSTTIYSGSIVFSSTSTSYVATTPILLTVGHSYTINRIQTNWGTDLYNKPGRLVTNASGTINFPITFGDLRITGATSYDLSNPGEHNQIIPYIDLVFES